VYTILAHLWRRYRAPGTRLRRIGTRKDSPLARGGRDGSGHHGVERGEVHHHPDVMVGSVVTVEVEGHRRRRFTVR